jgi:hypothetical protein
MNHILHNISLLILFTGIIFITVYITKASSNGFLTWDQQLLAKRNRLRLREPISIYDYRVSKEYKKMFSQPSIWLGYQDFDADEPKQKLYIKN